MKYFQQNGYLELQQLQEESFKSLGSISVLFDGNREQVGSIIRVVKNLNTNAEVA